MTSTARSVPVSPARFSLTSMLLAAAALFVGAVMVWQAFTAAGAPDPFAPNTGRTAAALDIGVLVFREGLECILVLAALTANMVGARSSYQRPVAWGAGIGIVASLITWQVAVGIVEDLTGVLPALHVQVITGLLAIVVLLVVMNWFFHKVYWTGWISFHTKRKEQLLDEASTGDQSRAKLLWGLIILGFTSVYREGFEIVLFLQSYRMRLGSEAVYQGVSIGLLLTVCVAALTFVAHRRLPYKKMLVLTGVMLGCVLLVMVGEQAQEMQLAHWISTTPIPSLERLLPAWVGLWFSVFPNVESLVAQAVALVIVLGSYFIARNDMFRTTLVTPDETPAA
jgi:high-affinity iron transporter